MHINIARLYIFSYSTDHYLMATSVGKQKLYVMSAQEGIVFTRQGQESNKLIGTEQFAAQ